MIYQLALLFVLCQGLVGEQLTTNGSIYTTAEVSTTTTNTVSLCNRTIYLNGIYFICPSAPPLINLEIDDLNWNIIESIYTLSVTGLSGSRGPLTTIPSNICHFTNLTNLFLSYNQIQSINYNFTTPCLPQLQMLDLQDNFLTELPVTWMNQMPYLDTVYWGSNRLTCLPYNISNNVSSGLSLWVNSNCLSTIELWTLQVYYDINYDDNPVERFSNYYNVDLSVMPLKSTPYYPNIHFDDTIFEMSNRCAEVHNISNFFAAYYPNLTLTILSIMNYSAPFYFRCACDQYYFYRVAFAARDYLYDEFFFNWTCPSDTLPFAQKCNYQSSANFASAIPRLCKISDSEPGQVPVYADSTLCGLEHTKLTSIRSPQCTTTTTQLYTTTSQLSTTSKISIATTSLPIDVISHEILTQLENITLLDSSSAQQFATAINQATINQSTTIDHTVTAETQNNFQQAILQAETLIETVNSTLNISDAAVAVFSRTKNNSINHLAQIIANSTQTYSSESDNNDTIASITIDQTFIDQLSPEDIYSFFFLPSSMFHYAQEDRSVNIVSPIVGAHLPNEQLVTVNMSFDDVNSERSSGTYSCVFWQFNRWNDSGCIYSKDPITHRHHCVCNHLTSFALIFTPNGTLPQTYLPSAVAAILSIVGLILSIILSVYQQTTPQASRAARYLPITNIFSLLTTLILFILLSVILFSKQQSFSNTTQCQSSPLNLALSTYFFVILTFATKTLLGICYFMTIFIRFELVGWSAIPGRWFLTTLLLIILLALIPTIVASILAHQWSNVFLQYESICWFSLTYLIKFITIPVSLFIGINVIVIVLISIRLIRFVFYTTAAKQGKGKRSITAVCIWLTSCILLGVAWIIGPLLGIFVDQEGQTSSSVGQGLQWIFVLLIGLEGVWVLIVNVLFYSSQRPKRQHHSQNSPEKKRKWVYTDDLGGIPRGMNGYQGNRNGEW